MNVLELRSLTLDEIPAALELDRRALGGIWKWDGYQREIESPNSDLLVLRQRAYLPPPQGAYPLPPKGVKGRGQKGEAESASVIGHASFVKDNEQRPEDKEPKDIPPDSPRGQGHPPRPPKGTKKIQNPKAKILSPTPYSLLPTPHSPLLALGCSWAIVEEAHITLLAVDPQYQQQGLGQAMLYALLKAAYQRQLERATLEVRVSNEAALALYTKFGFKEAGRRKRYYQDTGEDALVLWRGGLHHPQFSQELEQWQKGVGDRLGRAGWELELKKF